MTSRGTAGAAALVLLLFQVARATAGDETPAEPATKDAAAARATPGAGPTGVLCLRKLPPPIDFATERKGSSGLGDLVFQDTRARQVATRPVLVVTVDDRAAVTVDQKNGGCVEGLALGVTHVVRASRPGVSRQAARFSFVTDGDSGNVLELHYDPFYGNIHIEPPRPARPATTGAPSCAVCAAPLRPKSRNDRSAHRDAGSLRGTPPRQ